MWFQKHFEDFLLLTYLFSRNRFSEFQTMVNPGHTSNGSQQQVQPTKVQARDGGMDGWMDGRRERPREGRREGAEPPIDN